MATEANSKCPDKVTVIVDTREQYPVRFPANVRIADPSCSGKGRLVGVTTVRRKMDAGDYCLEGWEECCAIERKGSPLELYKNLFDRKDKLRCGRAFTRLVTQVDHPYLMLESGPKDILTGHLPYDVDPELLLSKVTQLVASYGLGLLWMPWKRASGKSDMGIALVHLMLSHVINTYYTSKPKLI